MADVGLLAAFAAGGLALLSPCSALLLPSFFAYAFANRSELVLRTVLFYLGLLVTLVPLGVGVSAVSGVFYGHRPLLIAVAGWMIIGFGAMQILGRSFATPFAGRIHRAARGITSRRTGWVPTLALGAVYGLAGFCSGPILGAILTLAATQGSPLQGGVLLATYALGMAAPLFVLAALWDRFNLGQRAWLRGRELHWGPLRVHTTALLSGILFIAIGVLFLRFDGTAGVTGALGLADTTDVVFSAQQAITSGLEHVPGWVLPAAVAVAAVAVGVRRWRSDRRPSDRAPGEVRLNESTDESSPV